MWLYNEPILHKQYIQIVNKLGTLGDRNYYQWRSC